MTDAAVMLGQLRENLATIEESDDRAAMRQIVETLLHEVVVHTTGQGRDKTATLTIRYAFGGTSAIDTTRLKPTAPPTANCSAGRRRPA